MVTPVLALPPGFELPKGCDWSQVASVTPVASWRFRGISRFDAVISGGLAKGEVTVEPAWNSPDLLACIGIDEAYNGPHPIAGGSDAGVPEDRGLSGRPMG